MRSGPPYDVGAIGAPVVYGRSDPQVMPSVVEFLASRIETFEVMELPGAGHHAHRRAPDAFADLVRRGVTAGVG